MASTDDKNLVEYTTFINIVTDCNIFYLIAFLQH